MRGRPARYWVRASLVLLAAGWVLAVAVLWMRWGGRPAEQEAAPAESSGAAMGTQEAADPPALELTGSELIGWYQGKRQWRLRARRVQVESDSSLTRLEDIREGVIYRDGQPYLGFASAGGEWDPESGSLRLWGGVELTFEGRTVFSTESLHWDGESERLVVPGRVRLFWDGRELAADRLEADVRSQTITAIGNVRIAQTGQAIEAERVIINLSTEEVRAEGAARLIVELSADR
ncbi:MAG: LPS export ABC transporter periplasmic protein LptC [Limnochordales bacterium]|nr:LPS export ABC transporter periplasmic protein LptC [Limnochordales bacterium]